MRLLKPVDYKVHPIINAPSKREFQLRKNIGSESLGAISLWRPKPSIDRQSFLELRDLISTPINK